MSDVTGKILQERGKTHGFFPDHAAVTQLIKAAIYAPRVYLPNLSDATEGGTDRYDATQREGLEMIAHKLGRIVAGNSREPDHWADIAGYARLVADHLERGRASVDEYAPGWDINARPAPFQAPGTECPECGCLEGERHHVGCSRCKPEDLKAIWDSLPK